MTGLGDRPSDHAYIRTDRIVAALRKAMAIIEAEIDANSGLYPYNAGRLSQAELCRRAGVAQVTLQNPSHKNTTLVEVNKWLARVRAKIVTGKVSVRKAVTDRVDRWKAEYEHVSTHLNISRLEVADLRTQLATVKKAIETADAEIAKLKEENLSLRTELSKGKVVRMPSKTR